MRIVRFVRRMPVRRAVQLQIGSLIGFLMIGGALILGWPVITKHTPTGSRPDTPWLVIIGCILLLACMALGSIAQYVLDFRSKQSNSD